MACAEARPILASLAAAPFFAAVVGRFEIATKDLSQDTRFGGFFIAPGELISCNGSTSIRRQRKSQLPIDPNMTGFAVQLLV